MSSQENYFNPFRIHSFLFKGSAVSFYLLGAAVTLLSGVQQAVPAAGAHADGPDRGGPVQAAGLSSLHEVGQLPHAAVTEELRELLTPESEAEEDGRFESAASAA